MNRRPRSQRLMTEINITPFTDVILVLLIIFMAAAPFLMRSSVSIHLPRTAKIHPPPSSKDINVLIAAGGDVYLEQKVYSLRSDYDLLKFKFSALARSDEDTALVINADKNVKYDFVMQAIDLATQAGVKQIVLATEVSK